MISRRDNFRLFASARLSLSGRFILGALLMAATVARARFAADLAEEDGVSIRLEAEPAAISPGRDLMVTLTVEAPAHLAVTLPDLRDRLSGFSRAEDFASAPVQAGGRSLQTFHWKLTPEPAARRYRLAPFAVEVRDTRLDHAPPPVFLATRPVLFPGEGARPPVVGDPEIAPKPDWIAPTPRTIAAWILLALALAAVVAALLAALTRLSRRMRESRMSPVERALAELQRLLNRNLPGRGLFKDFYIELTQVVRRYIERAHAIHAPEQTTQEFLEAAARHPAFPPDTLAKLRVFLEDADLIKFAGRQASIEMTGQAAESARAYIREDAARFVQPASSSTPRQPD